MRWCGCPATWPRVQERCPLVFSVRNWVPAWRSQAGHACGLQSVAFCPPNLKWRQVVLCLGEQVGRKVSCLCWKRSRATSTSLLLVGMLYGGDRIKGVNQNSPFDISGLLGQLFRGKKREMTNALMEGGLWFIQTFRTGSPSRDGVGGGLFKGLCAPALLNIWTYSHLKDCFASCVAHFGFYVWFLIIKILEITQFIWFGCILASALYSKWSRKQHTFSIVISWNRHLEMMDGMLEGINLCRFLWKWKHLKVVNSTCYHNHLKIYFLNITSQF